MTQARVALVTWGTRGIGLAGAARPAPEIDDGFNVRGV